MSNSSKGVTLPCRKGARKCQIQKAKFLTENFTDSTKKYFPNRERIQ